MSNGARRAPQEIKMLLAVLPDASCQGLFGKFDIDLSRYWLRSMKLSLTMNNPFI